METTQPPPPEPSDSDPQKNCAPQSVPETDLARALGVTRDVLRAHRGEKNRDWTGGDGRPVLITPEGQERLQALLSAAAGTEPIGDAVAAAQRAEERYLTLTVTRVYPRLLEAKNAADPDARCRVLVRDSSNFIAGMEVPRCEPSTTTPGVYYFHGRLPRFRGRF